MGKNPILMGQALSLTPRYFVVMDEGNAFFQSGEELLQFLKNNDVSECGCQLMTDEEWANVKVAAS